LIEVRQCSHAYRDIFRICHTSGHGSRMIAAVRDSPSPLRTVWPKLLIFRRFNSGIRFALESCYGGLSKSDAGARSEWDFTTSRSPFPGGAICASGHRMAARKSARLGRRNPATRPARRLSRPQERALRTRETAQDETGCIESQHNRIEF
jgi:hypothetical protein